MCGGRVGLRYLGSLLGAEESWRGIGLSSEERSGGSETGRKTRELPCWVLRHFDINLG